MGVFTSTPVHSDLHEDRNHLLGLLVGEKTIELRSEFWERLLGLPHIPLDRSFAGAIEAACGAMSMHAPQLALHFDV
jgi:hypothetical protein